MLRINTETKQPKLWNAAVLSIAAAVVITILTIIDADANAAAIAVILDIYLLSIIVCLVRAFIKQIKFNLYSYNTIWCIGFAIFLMALFMTYLHLTVRLIGNPDRFMGQNMVQILQTMVDSAQAYILYTSPFILVFSVALCISNISLIRHEGRRFVNLLGIILSVLLLGIAAVYLVLEQHVSGSGLEVKIHELIANIIASMYLYFECMIIGTIIAHMIAIRYQPSFDKDFIIILGCGIMPDGTPTPLLRGRVDRAIAFANKQKKATGRDIIFVPSGGQGPREVTSECAAMKGYLMKQGIPESRIIEEDQSRNTFENMKFSKAKIDAVNPDGKVAFSTTNYHVFRSGLYASRVGLRAVGMGARTKWYFWPNASVREFIGLLRDDMARQGLLLAAIVAYFIIFTLVSY